MIEIQDETIRDGMQQKGVRKHFKAKCEAADILAAIPDITSVEIGMCTTKEDLRLLKELIKHLAPWQEYAVLTRLKKEDIQMVSHLAGEQLVIKLLVPISRLHVEKKLGISMLGLYEKLKDCMKLVSKLHIKMEVCLEDATRAKMTDLYELLSICSEYPVRYVTFCDTVGCMTMDEYRFFIGQIKEKKYPFHISVHCHNDMGLATANTLAGVLAGADRIETTFLGIGERAGNTAIDEIMYILQKKGYIASTDLKKLYQASCEMKKILNFKPSEVKPLLGENVFVHESGIHQDGILKNREMYQYVSPEEFGLGKLYETSLSGISSVRLIKVKAEDYIRQQAYPIDAEEIVSLYKTLSKIIGAISIEEVCDLYYLKENKEKIYDNNKKYA